MKSLLTACAALLLVSEVACAQPLPFSGFIQNWVTDSSETTRSTVAHARLRTTGKSSLDTSYALMVEMAPSKKLNTDTRKMEETDLLLLDAYLEYTPGCWNGGFVRYGQFKFPFGQDRMPVPQALELVDYSIINRAVFPGHDWDLGLEAGVRRKDWSASVAFINGTGPGVFDDDNSSKDISARFEVYSLLPRGSAVGLSYYSGKRFEGSGVGDRDWFGTHVKYATADSREHPLLLQGEYISRSDGLDAWTIQGSYRTSPKWLWAAKYDRVRPDSGAKRSRIWIGPSYQSSKEVEITLNWMHDSVSSMGTTDSAILQTQVLF